MYVRYLTDGAEIGDETGAFLTVGTYPFPGVQATLEEQADHGGALVNETPDGNLVVTNRNEATSVYIADPDQELQVEVYDPDPERAFDARDLGWHRCGRVSRAPLADRVRTRGPRGLAAHLSLAGRLGRLPARARRALSRVRAAGRASICRAPARDRPCCPAAGLAR